MEFTIWDKLLLLLLSFLIIITLTSCAATNYKKAVANGNIASYSKFINNHRNNEKYVELARNSIDSIQFTEASKINTISSFESYIKTHKQNNALAKLSTYYLDQAIEQIEYIKYKDCLSKGIEKHLQKFLNEYPQSKYHSVIKSQYEELLYTKAINAKTAYAYNNYINKFPNTTRALELKKNLNRVLYTECMEMGNPNACADYLFEAASQSEKGTVLTQFHRLRIVNYVRCFSGSQYEREYAEKKLMELKDPFLIRYLYPSLQSNNSGTIHFRTAIKLISEIGVDSSQYFIKLLNDNSIVESWKKNLILDELAKTGSKESIPTLINLLNSNDIDTSKVLKTIVSIQDSAITNVLSPFLNATNSDVKLTTINLLGKVKDISAMELLKPISQMIEFSIIDTYHKKAALQSLALHSDTESFKKLINLDFSSATKSINEHNKYQFIPILMSHIDSDNTREEEKILELFAKLNYRDSNDYILTKLNSKNARVQRSAIDAIGNLRDSTLIPYLYPLINNKVLRTGILKAIEQCPLESAYETIKTLLSDNEYYAFEVMCQLPTSRINDDIVKFLKNYPKKLKNYSFSLQGISNDYVEYSRYYPLLTSPNQTTKVRTLSFLSKMQDTNSMPYIIPLLDDSSSKIQQSAILALETLNSGTFEDNVPELLRSNNKYVVKGTINSLARMNSLKSIPEISEKLKSTDSNLRLTAAQAIRKMIVYSDDSKVNNLMYIAEGDKKAIQKNIHSIKPMLRQFLHNESTTEYAIHAIFIVGIDDFKKDLVKTLNTRNSKKIATWYLNSGNSFLKNEAIKWGKKKGMQIEHIYMD